MSKQFLGRRGKFKVSFSVLDTALDVGGLVAKKRKLLADDGDKIVQPDNSEAAPLKVATLALQKPALVIKQGHVQRLHAPMNLSAPSSSARISLFSYRNPTRPSVLNLRTGTVVHTVYPPISGASRSRS
jgi:hypothetical protein